MPKPTKNTESPVSSLVLLAKMPGRTSFSSLFSVKHALGTKKVGHTGTLDSFAEGLLVVCTGGLTRIASRITAFDKEYEAIIAFGKETDTLDPYGAAVRTAPLPTVEGFTNAFNSFKGELMQRPPAFSALHVGGKRASDLARKGVEVEVPERPINVFSSSIKKIREKDGFVEYAHVVFHVSKGTYIRSLARDIALSCGSAAHLVGLLRTKVGSFRLEDAAGYTLLKPFTIERVVYCLENVHKAENPSGSNGRVSVDGTTQGDARGNADVSGEADEQTIQAEIRQKMRGMTPDLAVECGFTPVFLKDGYIDWFYHGKPLTERIFLQIPPSGESPQNENANKEYAVFAGENKEKSVFAGMVERHGKAFRYMFVIPLDND